MKPLNFHNCVYNRRHRPLRSLVLLVACSLGQYAPAQQQDETPKEPVVEGQVYDHRGAGTADVDVSLSPANDEAQALATTKTNQYGDFAIHHDTPLSGSFVVTFRKAGYTETRREIEIVPGDLPPFIELLLPGSLTLHGTVANIDAEKPISEASVRLDAAGRSWNATTASDGTFIIENIFPGQGTITVTASGFGREKHNVDDLAKPTPVRINLGPERICKIIVGDWRGTPIQDAKLTAYDDHLHARWFGQSDKEGLITLQGLHREATLLNVQLTHPNYVSDVDAARELALPEGTRESEHQLALLAAGTVEGVVRDRENQDPLQGVRVTVGASMNPSLPRTWTGFDGKFSIPGVPPGPTIVTTYLRSYAPELQSAKVKPNEVTTVEFAMVATREAAGTVVNAEGDPIPNAYLFATSWRSHSTLGVQALTDDNGRFTMETIPADEFAVSIQAPGSETLEDQIITPGKTDHRFELKERPKPPAPANAPKVGEPFPDLELTTTDSRKFKTADFKGKWVLIDFWATWCGPCVAEIPDLVKLHEAFADRDDFLMINITAENTQSKVAKFIKKNKMTWPQVFGPKSGAQEANTACGITAIPTKFLIAPDGTLKSTDLTAGTLKTKIQNLLPPKPAQN